MAVRVTESGTRDQQTPQTPLEVPRVLVITNDYPPRVGGVQQYVWNLLRHLRPDRLSVFAPNWDGSREHDHQQPYPVHRWPATMMWPTPDLTRRARSLAREHSAEVVMFGHGLPLGLLGPELAAAGIPYVVLTHGMELWIARVPGPTTILKRALSAATEVVSISEYMAGPIRRLLQPGTPMSIVYPGVDADRFRPDVDGAPIRERHGLRDRPVVLCVSRLVSRKGQDVLIDAMSVVRRLVPDAVLLIVGDGPYRPKLEALAADAPRGSVVFSGEAPETELPMYYAACDVFAMPCRNRWGGLEVEGFGIVFLEAAAAAKAAVAGRSGGSDEAVADEQTGLLVEGREPKAVGLAIARLLNDPALAARLGSAGRARVEAQFTWPKLAGGLAEILSRAVQRRPPDRTR